MLLTIRPKFLTTVLLSLWLFANGARANEKVQYNRDIRPILTDACFKCHGPAARKGGFRLDLRDEATKPAKSGDRPIVEGKPAESEMIKRILSTSPDEVMPPPSAHKTLKPEQKEMLKRWITEG